MIQIDKVKLKTKIKKVLVIVSIIFGIIIGVYLNNQELSKTTIFQEFIIGIISSISVYYIFYLFKEFLSVWEDDIFFFINEIRITFNKLNFKKIKNFFKVIHKSYIWLILPLSIMLNFYSCSSYIDAGTHLTKKSVSVRGYTRQDGVHINSYNRRPPGGVKHDAPFKRKRFWMGFLSSIFFIITFISILNFYISLNLIFKGKI